MRPAVHIVDFEAGNIGSVCRMVKRLGFRPEIVSEASQQTEKSLPIVMPGVGHFSRATQALDRKNLRGWLQDCFAGGVPILGICLGAQLFCEQSEEGQGSGLAWVEATVRRFRGEDGAGRPLKVPQMGWREFAPPEGCLPFGVPAGRMYFAHSYFIEAGLNPEVFPCQANYGSVRFTTVVRAGRALGVQFHPEKSHRHGIAFLKAWLDWAGGILPSSPAFSQMKK
jgi:glutamine amidotransferase